MARVANHPMNFSDNPQCPQPHEGPADPGVVASKS